MSATNTAAPAMAGTRMWRANLERSVLRQPSMGHTAMSKTTNTATGRATALYAPAATTAPPRGIQLGRALDTVR